MRLMVFAGALAASVSGCATITRGTTNEVQLRSEPSEARATTSLNQSCMTPCTLNVSRKSEFAVTFQKEGYEARTVEVQTQVAGAGAAGFAGNILIGGVVGMGADAVTGATLEHSPNPVSVVLVPIVPEPLAKRRLVRRGRPPA